LISEKYALPDANAFGQVITESWQVSGWMHQIAGKPPPAQCD